jgi:hypothetical protein
MFKSILAYVDHVFWARLETWMLAYVVAAAGTKETIQR